MAKKLASHLTLPEIKTRGLIFDLKAEMDFADEPLIIMDARVRDPFLKINLIFSGKDLETLGQNLIKYSKLINNTYHEYWKQKGRNLKSSQNSLSKRNKPQNTPENQ